VLYRGLRLRVRPAGCGCGWHAGPCDPRDAGTRMLVGGACRQRARPMRDARVFARVRVTVWQVGLDVGPVKAEVSAVTARASYRGRAMNRAARIAAKAPAGQVRMPPSSMWLYEALRSRTAAFRTGGVAVWAAAAPGLCPPAKRPDPGCRQALRPQR
jgi:hypothetical protein